MIGSLKDIFLNAQGRTGHDCVSQGGWGTTASLTGINFDSTKKEAALIGSLIQCLNFKRAFQFNDLVEDKVISV